MKKQDLLSRRDALKLGGMGALTSIVGAGAAFSVNSAFGGHKHDHHDQSHKHHANKHMAMDPKVLEVVESSYDCVMKSELCLQHCLAMFKMGDTSLAECAIVVKDTIAACQAVAELGGNQSKHLKPFVKACIDVCKDCEDECRKHEKHAECKSCGDACAECIKVYKAFLA